MNREDFIHTLRDQYADEIHAAYIHCEHSGTQKVDFKELSRLLENMVRLAKTDGLSEADFWELVRCTIPEASDYLYPQKKAA